MPVDLPAQDSLAAMLESYEPERYWALWQHPEGRYAYSVGLRRDAWLIVMDSEEAGRSALLDDAHMNGRSPSQYRIDELTLPEAFEAARSQSVPFKTSYGGTVKSVKGIEVRSVSLFAAARARKLPL